MAEWGWDLLRSFLGAGAGTAAVTGAISLLRDRGKKRSESAYLAMRLAVTLEKYASDCSSLIYANKNAWHHPDEEFPNWDMHLPKLDEYPPDAEGWKAITPDIAADCLNFRNRIAESQSSVRGVIEYHEEDLEQEVRRQASELGLEAWNLARKLRSVSGLKPIKPAFDYAHHLERAKAQTAAEDEAQREINQEIYDSV